MDTAGNPTMSAKPKVIFTSKYRKFCLESVRNRNQFGLCLQIEKHCDWPSQGGDGKDWRCIAIMVGFWCLCFLIKLDTNSQQQFFNEKIGSLAKDIDDQYRAKADEKRSKLN